MGEGRRGWKSEGEGGSERETPISITATLTFSIYHNSIYNIKSSGIMKLHHWKEHKHSYPPKIPPKKMFPSIIIQTVKARKVGSKNSDETDGQNGYSYLVISEIPQSYFPGDFYREKWLRKILRGNFNYLRNHFNWDSFYLINPRPLSRRYVTALPSYRHYHPWTKSARPALFAKHR